MSEVKKTRMKPRLGQLMAEKGGMYVAEALKRADAALEVLREPSLNGIDEYITALDALLTAELDDHVRIRAFYNRASDVISLSGAERNEAVEVAARSLCDLLDEAEALTPTLLAAIQVHVASIKLLHRAAPDPAMHAPVLKGLAALVEKQRNAG